MFIFLSDDPSVVDEGYELVPPNATGRMYQSKCHNFDAANIHATGCRDSKFR
jgi:hypothetical protein